MPRFSKTEALQFGWQTVRTNLGYFFGLSAVFILASAVLTPLQAYFSESPVVALVIAILSIALTLIVDLGFMKITLKTYDGEPTDFPDLFRYYDLSPRYFLGTVIFTLLILTATVPGIVVVSLVVSGIESGGVGTAAGILLGALFLIPVAFVSIRFYFFGYFILDKEAGPLEAFKLSAQLTKGETWHLLLLFLVLVAVVLAGLVAFVVGILVAYPVALLTTTYVYRKLLETQEQNQ
ncbi:MAG: hypothetical protein HN521_00800 [Candidatus Latescibacteria bacterium]|jgi:hypothetical protein|nr:hypothetical protein [Candidatus Latescibacterota bacterium]